MKRMLLATCVLAATLAGVRTPVAEPAAGADPVVRADVPVAISRFTNSVGMELVRLPAGEYLCYGHDIKPEFLFPKPKGFKVKVEQAFCIGATDVTQRQYAIVMGLRTGLFHKGSDYPVTHISWNDAVEFCRRLSALPAEKAAGRVYSLPTEREWQYAARAGSEYLFPYGSDDEMRVAEVAVCRDIYTGALPKGVQAVGTKKPNAWGLYDVLGNVWEWVQDAWPADAPPNAAPVTSSAAALDKGDNRVIVGGGWDNDFRMCNLAARYSAPPTRKADNIGFRVRCMVNK
jgi:formylglycine-generating enzyme required for sulfatase activity